MALKYRFGRGYGGRQVPEPDLAVQPTRAGGQQPVARGKGQGVHFALRRLQDGPLAWSAARDIPKADIPVDGPGGQGAPIRRPSHRHDPASMAFETVDFRRVFRAGWPASVFPT